MEITQLMINGIEDPIGYFLSPVVCSWKVEGTESRYQENVKIEVSTKKDFSEILWKKEGKDLCQSGTVIDISLDPRTAYYYRVSVTGEKGDAASASGCFETGKMDEKWDAEWICAPKDENIHPVLRKNFFVNRPVKRTRLYITGVGLFEVYLNGQKLGKEYLTPYVNNYEVNIQTMTFRADVPEGENSLEILLGKGWYMGKFGLEGEKCNYGNRMAAIGELYLEYADGTTERLCTDSTWFWRGSDVEESGIYYGETLNHLLWENKENPWKPVDVLLCPEAEEGTKNLAKERLMDRLSLPVVVKEEIPVKEIIHTPAGETVLDMGQNFAGFIEFFSELPRETKIILDFGEILQQGNFYNGNYREAESRFVYVSDGIPRTVRPHFTFFGFRYVRISGWPGEPTKKDFRGKVLYSDIRRTGYIHTSNEKINRLYENTVWGLKSNFIDIPTDCPQRNERLGWTGDAQVFAPTASYHMDTRAFFHKFVKDLRDEQRFLDGAIPNYVPNIGHKPDAGSVWGDISTFLPYTLFRYYGNMEEMKYCYPMMKDWVDYIDRKDSERKEKRYLFDFGFHFGDWLALDGPTQESFKGSTDDTYIASMYYCQSVKIVKIIAGKLGKSEEEKHYAELEDNIRKAILREYFTPSGRLAMTTQASYVVALKFDICIDRNRTIREFKECLKKDGNQIRCGFVGAPMLCTVLAEAGLYELAYDFLLREGFPGWLYSVNLGATTVWERWNSVLEDGTISPTGMNSLNHYAYGSVMEFMYAYAAGIRPAEPGFRKAYIAPHPDIRLPEICCSYDSVNGKYVCNFAVRPDGKLHVYVEIPFNCTAELELPDYDGGVQELPAGKYEFEYEPLKDYRHPYGWNSTLYRIGQDERALGILEKYAPPLAGMAKAADPEFGFETLEAVSHLGFLPFDPDRLASAVEELMKLTV